MSGTGYYLRLECVRMLRDPRYLALAVLAPIGFYLLFSSIFGGGPVPPGQLGGTVEIMVAMAAYGAIWGVLSATGPRISQERASGWVEQLRALPLNARPVVLSKLAAGMLVALPAILLVCLTAVLARGVRLDAWQWAALVPLVWLGSLPFALLGTAVGYAVGAETAFPLSYALYLAMSALGGLWVPPARLSAPLRQAAYLLPSYRLADLGWSVAAGHAPGWADAAVLAGWTLLLGALAALAYHRPRLRRAARPPAPAHGRVRPATGGDTR